MGKLFVLMGKSASGKDTLMTQLLSGCPHIKRVISYTTRPQRENEKNGNEYHFVSDSFFEEKKNEGKVIEERIYHTEHGTWKYGTIDEGKMDFSKGSYIAIKDPLGAEKLKAYYGEENVISILVSVDDGIRLMRALTRELSQDEPKYVELCHRFLSDEVDFADAKADFVINNTDVVSATSELKRIIKENRK